MNPHLELELYRRLVAYLSGLEQLRDFRQWFDAATWDQRPWNSALIGSVELTVAEYLSGDRSETEVRDAFFAAISNATLFVPLSAPLSVITDSDSVTKATPMWGATVTSLGSPSGQKLVAGSV